MSAQGQSRIYKRGEVIFKEGDKATTLYLVQSGQVSLQLARSKPIELFVVGPMQIIGDHALAGVPVHPHTALATTETKVLELPLEAVKAQVDTASQMVKLLARSLWDKSKLLQNELKSVRMERDAQACPPDQLAKILGSLFHAAHHKGEKQKDGSIVVSWHLLRQYAQRVFMESPKRLESTLQIFVKLGAAKLVMQKNEEDPDAPEEIGSVVFSNLDLVEWVFEHWQFYYFKGGKTEFLRTDEKTMQVVSALVEYAREETVDRSGSVRIDFTKVVERFKAESGIVLNADYFGVMETRGLFVKRVSTDTGVFLQFELKEFKQWSQIWVVLKEIERWNEKGFVDLQEPAFDPRKFQKAASGHSCANCGHGYDGTPKFCVECGAPLKASA